MSIFDADPRYCDFCGKQVPERASPRPKIFCDIDCKAEWQRTNKEWKEKVKEYCPTKITVTKEWMEQKYITERLTTYQIAKLIGKSQSTALDWIRKLGITLRKHWDYPPYMLGKKHPPETIEKMRQIAIAQKEYRMILKLDHI